MFKKLVFLLLALFLLTVSTAYGRVAAGPTITSIDPATVPVARQTYLKVTGTFDAGSVYFVVTGGRCSGESCRINNDVLRNLSDTYAEVPVTINDAGTFQLQAVNESDGSRSALKSFTAK